MAKDCEKMQRDAIMNYKANGGNMKQAMIDAGYAATTASRQQKRLLKKVGQQIEEVQKEIDSPKIKSIQEIQEWWCSIMDNEEESTKDRLRASENLTKSMGGFVDNVNVKGNVNNPFADLTTEELKKLVDDD